MKKYISLKNLHLPFIESVIHVDKYLNTLRDEFYKIFDKVPIIGTTKEIINFLNNFFKSYNITFDTLSGESRNGVIKGKCKHDLKIIIFCSNNLSDYFENRYKFSRFLDRCIFTLAHELVHRGQYIQMNKHLFLNKTNGRDIDLHDIDVNHYKKSDEIMAYANLIIEELRFNGYDNKQILEGIRNDRFGIEDSEFLELYKIHFKTDKKVIGRLYKYIYEYLKSPVKVEL